MLIRAYNDSDADAVRELFIRVNRELAPQAMSAEFEAYIARSLRDEIDCIPGYYSARDGKFFVAEISGMLAGMYGVERVDHRSVELRRMYVAPELRRRGIARRLLDHAERYCREKGFQSLVLSTSELQLAALGLYTSCDFQLLREESAASMTNKTVGGGLRRFHFAKPLVPATTGRRH